MLMVLMPLARTPWGKKDAASLKQYSDKVKKSLDASIPWKKTSRSKESLRGKVKPGEVVVLLESGEQLDPEFTKGAKVTRE